MILSLKQAKARIDLILGKYASTASPTSVVGNALTAGKVYEAWVLSLVLERLRLDEGYDVLLVGSTEVHLKSSPGPINIAYPHFVLTKPGQPSLAVWTDVEFTTLSYSMQGLTTQPPGGAYRHELDIVVVFDGVSGYPAHDEIRLGVECKNTGFEKAMMRAALGVRRELSLLRYPLQETFFSAWPRTAVAAAPPSVLMVYSTDSKVATYNDAGQAFGVDFVHAPM